MGENTGRREPAPDENRRLLPLRLLLTDCMSAGKEHTQRFKLLFMIPWDDERWLLLSNGNATLCAGSTSEDGVGEVQTVTRRIFHLLNRVYCVLQPLECRLVVTNRWPSLCCTATRPPGRHCQRQNTIQGYTILCGLFTAHSDSFLMDRNNRPRWTVLRSRFSLGVPTIVHADGCLNKCERTSHQDVVRLRKKDCWWHGRWRR